MVKLDRLLDVGKRLRSSDLEKMKLETFVGHAMLILGRDLYPKHETGLTFLKFEITLEKNAAHIVAISTTKFASLWSEILSR